MSGASQGLTGKRAAPGDGPQDGADWMDLDDFESARAQCEGDGQTVRARQSSRL